MFEGSMNKSCYQIIAELEADNSRLAKEAIIQANVDNQELFEGFRMALDNLYTFGVKKVPTHGGPDGQGLPWAAFKELAHLLYTRQLTGHAARDAIELALSASTQVEWNDWYRRILIKDLRCGVSEKTINKIKKNAVPIFEVQLAHDGANHEKKLVGKKLLEPKFDGVRCLTVVNAENRTVTQFTRNGKVLENFGHITAELEKHIDLFERSYVIDGEIVSSSFQALMKQVHRKENVQAGDAILMAFDVIPLAEFKLGFSTMGQRRRSALLRNFKHVFDKCGNIELTEQKEIDLDTYVGELEFKEFNRNMIEQGFEGIMVKDVDAQYECKRSHSWLKIKPFIEVSLEVTAVEEGTGRNEGRLGALVCEGTDDGKSIQVNVGSGFSDDQRKEFWFNKDSLPEQIVEVRADAITLNQDGTYSLRFPRFLRFRGFKKGEKI